MIKHIAFDIMGVLITEGSLVGKTLLPLLGRKEDENAKIKYKDYSKNIITEEQFWNEIGVPDYSEIKRKYLDLFQIDPNYENVIKNLKKNNITIGIISNLTTEWYEDFNSRFKFTYTFSPILISSQIGVRKPDHEIFIKYKEQLDLNFSEFGFVDDTEKNVIACKELGIKSIWLNKQNEQPTSKHDLIINSLNDLTKTNLHNL